MLKTSQYFACQLISIQIKLELFAFGTNLQVHLSFKANPQVLVNLFIISLYVCAHDVIEAIKIKVSYLQLLLESI